MKTIMLILVLTIVHSLAVNVSASEKDDPGSIFDSVLSRYVSEDGLVDYKGLKEDKEFKKYIEYLAIKYLDYDWGLNEQK